jgi:hypothetical protein
MPSLPSLRSLSSLLSLPSLPSLPSPSSPSSLRSLPSLLSLLSLPSLSSLLSLPSLSSLRLSSSPCFVALVSALASALVLTLPARVQAAPRPFDHTRALAKIHAFDRAYRASYGRGVGRYFGRLWARLNARRQRVAGKDETVWQRYVKDLARRGLRPRRIDCTLYAQAVLEAGMDPDEYRELRREHNQLWPGRGFAGWSVGHLLVEKHGWKAYAFIRPGAGHYHYYLHFFRRKGEYPVWKQPNIRIERHFTLGRDDRAIEALLRRNRFGWGFSQGGIHTWITSGRLLKEVHFDAAPSRRYELRAEGLEPVPLFETTRLVEFDDYPVHLVVFPP